MKPHVLRPYSLSFTPYIDHMSGYGRLYPNFKLIAPNGKIIAKSNRARRAGDWFHEFVEIDKNYFEITYRISENGSQTRVHVRIVKSGKNMEMILDQRFDYDAHVGGEVRIFVNLPITRKKKRVVYEP